MTPSAEQQRKLLDFARSVMRQKLQASDLATPDLSDDIFHQPAGCFVTLHRLDNHRLRGCIGYIQAVNPLKDAVAEMAEATLEDSRFAADPVTAAELPELELEITIISPLEKAHDPLDFDLLNNGIVLKYAGRSGCFLPQVARETGWTKEQLLSRLCSEKMGLHPDSWKDSEAALLKFTATILGPEPFVK